MWYRPFCPLQLCECIGEGRFGTCWTAVNLDSGLKVCVKQIRKESLWTKFGQEVKHLFRCLHPNVVHAHDLVLNENGGLCLVMDYGGQSLRQWLYERKRVFTTDEVRSIMRQLLRGLAYLHDDRHLLHLDLSIDNVLLDEAGRVKIADFGNAMTVRAAAAPAAVTAPLPAAALHYRSPELLLGATTVTAAAEHVGGRLHTGRASTASARLCRLQ